MIYVTFSILCLFAFSCQNLPKRETNMVQQQYAKEEKEKGLKIKVGISTRAKS